MVMKFKLDVVMVALVLVTYDNYGWNNSFLKSQSLINL